MVEVPLPSLLVGNVDCPRTNNSFYVLSHDLLDDVFKHDVWKPSNLLVKASSPLPRNVCKYNLTLKCNSEPDHQYLTKTWPKPDQTWPEPDQTWPEPDQNLTKLDQNLTKTWPKLDQNLTKTWPKPDQNLTSIKRQVLSGSGLSGYLKWYNHWTVEKSEDCLT